MNFMQKKVDQFCADFLIGAFKKMPAGQLDLTLPSGQKILLGGKEPGPKAEVFIKHLRAFTKCFFYGDIGFGESYTDGDWETSNLSAVISWFITNLEFCPSITGSKQNVPVNILGFANKWIHRLRSNTLLGSKKNIQAHYDLSNDFFRLFLDPSLTYSSAYFLNDQEDLQVAQTRKYDMLCQKLRLKPQDELLEIGCGWGGFSLHAAKNYGAKISAITISRQQYNLAQERVQKEGLNEKVKILFKDYRDVQGKFDKIVSIEMLEAVGDAFLETYFAKCQELLNKNGLLALQYIACPDARHNALKENVDWIQKHIFPGSLLLSVHRVNSAVFKTGELFLHHLEDMTDSYALTLQRWQQEFMGKLSDVRAQGFDEHFIRKWNYYLCYCQAAFASRNIHVVQAVYTFANNRGLNRLETVS